MTRTTSDQRLLHDAEVPNEPTSSGLSSGAGSKTAPSHIIAKTQDHAAALVNALFQGNCWFAVTPLPDEQYRIEYKPDAETVVQKAADECPTCLGRGVVTGRSRRLRCLDCGGTGFGQPTERGR